VTVRLYVERLLRAGDRFELASAPARHVQVLRLQPGDNIVLFDGSGGEWSAEVLQIGRRDVTVRIGSHAAVDRELRRRVTIAFGMPANERMDALVEKATELGAGVIQPLVCERSVLRLSGERADKRVRHWQQVAVAACEQSGRTRVPPVEPVLRLTAWLDGLRAAPASAARRIVLSPDATQRLVEKVGPEGSDLLVLSGPEGGLGPDELAASRAVGFAPVSLGGRVLRADTAPLAVLAWCGLEASGER
jgi:16S rRNA (uracil1498-N3)-methyltransferase